MEIAGTMAKIAVVITVIANEDTLHSLMSHGGARRCLRHLRSKGNTAQNVRPPITVTPVSAASAVRP